MATLQSLAASINKDPEAAESLLTEFLSEQQSKVHDLEMIHNQLMRFQKILQGISAQYADQAKLVPDFIRTQNSFNMAVTSVAQLKARING